MTFFKIHWRIFLILMLATWLRVWQMPDKMIFFGDAAADLTQAVTAWQQKTLPLLGIPSSVPRFHQGPVSVWISLLVTIFFGPNLLAYGSMFVFISVCAVIVVYELFVREKQMTMAWVSSLFLGVFPLAVAQGRMPYHTTPIPVFLGLYFLALQSYMHTKKSHATVFWSVLAWALLFQFELVLLPLLLLIPYLVWRKKDTAWKKIAGETVAGLVLGLWPQLVYDLTHQFRHFGGFAVWVAYRVVAFFGYDGRHTFSLDSLKQTLSFFSTYLSRIFSGGSEPVFIVGCLFLCILLGVIFWRIWHNGAVPLPVHLAAVGCVIQSVSYLIHGAPSEAYFPPYLLFCALLFGYGVTEIKKLMPTSWTWTLSIAVVVYVGYLVAYSVQQNFFVSQAGSFSYSYGVAEQQQIAKTILTRTGGRYALHTTQPLGQFPSFFANLRWHLRALGGQEDTRGISVFIETPETVFFQNTQYTAVFFPSATVYFIEQ